jgi:hypothetical protein
MRPVENLGRRWNANLDFHVRRNGALSAIEAQSAVEKSDYFPGRFAGTTQFLFQVKVQRVSKRAVST